MPSNLELVRETGINTGRFSQLPKTLDARVDLSNLGDLKSLNQSPRVPVAAPTQSLSSQQQFFQNFKSPSSTSPTSPAVELSTSASGLSKVLSSPAAKGAGALGLVIALATEASNLGTSLADVSNELDGQGNRNRAAIQTKKNIETRYEKALADRQKINAANSKGSGSQSDDQNNLPPLMGGQSVGVQYVVTVKATFSGGEIQFCRGRNPSDSIPELQDAIKPVTGPISSITISPPDGGKTVLYQINGIEQSYFFGQNSRTSYVSSIQIVSITRADGQNDTSPAQTDPNPFTKYYAPPVDFYKNRESTDPNNPYSPNYFPYLPTIKVAGKPSLSPKDKLLPFAEPEKPIFAPPLSAAPNQSPTNDATPKLDRPNTGSNSPTLSSVTASAAASTSSFPVLDGGVFSPRPYESGKSDPSEYGNPRDITTGLTRDEFEKAKQARQDAPRVAAAAFDAKIIERQLRNLPTAVRNGETISAQEAQRQVYENSIKGDPIKQNAYKQAQSQASLNVSTPTPVTTPVTSPSPVDLGNIATTLGVLGLAVTAIGQRTTAIQNQTTPQAQQTNAKQGVCDAMQPQQCGFEGVKQATTEATAPIKDIANQNNGLLGNILAILNNLATFLQGELGKILKFLDNSIVDRAIAAANFAMNAHNALMLSNALGKTLAGVVDSVMNLTPFQFTNTQGQKTTASKAFSSNVSAIIINAIGIEQYTELTNDWKVANRIYQSSTSLLNKTERLLGAQSKVAQKGNIDVANIGNALRANGIVNPNSYPPMAATKEANTPPDLLVDVNSPLSSFQSQVRNLNAITKSINGTVRQISGIQKDFGKLADLTNKESKVRKSLRSQVANQAKVKAKFTFLQIKQIKQSGKK